MNRTKKTGAFKPTRWDRRLRRLRSSGFARAACPRGHPKRCHSEGPADFRFANHGIGASFGTDFCLPGTASLYPRRQVRSQIVRGIVSKVSEKVWLPAKMCCLVLENTALISTSRRPQRGSTHVTGMETATVFVDLGWTTRLCDLSPLNRVYLLISSLRPDEKPED